MEHLKRERDTQQERLEQMKKKLSDTQDEAQK
jgi:hypothetical protein